MIDDDVGCWRGYGGDDGCRSYDAFGGDDGCRHNDALGGDYLHALGDGDAGSGSTRECAGGDGDSLRMHWFAIGDDGDGSGSALECDDGDGSGSAPEYADDGWG